MFLGNGTKENLKIFCETSETSCHLSWAPVAEGMISKNKSEVWKKDTLDVFQQLDSMFGKTYKSVTRPVSLYETFNGKLNILFHNVTRKLRNVPIARNTDQMAGNYNQILTNLFTCTLTSGASIVGSFRFIFLALHIIIIILH